MNNTKERPIVLTAQEVNAVLAGDKTQHRMPVDADHSISLTYHSLEAGGASPERIDALPFWCPFGKVGDRLWVQEDHRPISWAFEDGEVTIEYRDGKRLHPHYLTEEELETNPNDDYPFAVVEELLARNIPILKDRDCFDFSNPDNLPHWRSADVMPHFASRILLKITDIRIEKLQDITVINAQAEGSPLQISMTKRYPSFTKACGEVIEWFKEYWNAKNSKLDRYDSNPWVWVIEFKVIKPSEVTK